MHSANAILGVLMIKAVYHLPLRTLRGFLLSLITLLALKLPIPCYARMCRLLKSLDKNLKS
ncbi:transposase [Neochlamydia sp. EPS4]|uniref:transposase n=1 Tax=Neochlamydia sp. EPS4 TaxID=1478175 RepID=UPI0026F3ADFF|nr:transposase [Neochlamydia sp. EPS4]